MKRIIVGIVTSLAILFSVFTAPAYAEGGDLKIHNNSDGEYVSVRKDGGAVYNIAPGTSKVIVYRNKIEFHTPAKCRLAVYSWLTMTLLLYVDRWNASTAIWTTWTKNKSITVKASKWCKST